MSQQLTFEKVADGVVCDGLSRGLWEIPGVIYREFMQMAETGGFWPYKVKVIGCNYKRDEYLIRIEEIE